MASARPLFRVFALSVVTTVAGAALAAGASAADAAPARPAIVAGAPTEWGRYTSYQACDKAGTALKYNGMVSYYYCSYDYQTAPHWVLMAG